MTTWDVAVIGAGAAGLMAAYRAADRGLSTLLLEKNTKIGVKILMSGGTRCNLTHATDAAGIVAAYGRPGRFLHSALASLSPDDLIHLFNQAGVGTKIEASGKVFPVSDRAIDVRDALVELVRQTDCTIRTSAPVTKLAIISDVFEISLADETFFAKNVILTTGGQSYPDCGTRGDGYVWAKQLGHIIVPPVPALAPLIVDEPWVRDLQGVTLADTGVTVLNGKKTVERSRGGFLFTHFGLSGPAPMDVSRAFSRFPTEHLTLRCDFWPAESFDQLWETTIQQLESQPKKSIGTIFSTVFYPKLTRRFVQQILALGDIDPAQRCGEISHKKLNATLQRFKSTDLRVQSTRGFKKAEVTAGGVDLCEVDSSTLQSKLQPGLYLAGEILDLDGPIGGYNFQAAFSTGWLAGEKVVDPSHSPQANASRN